MENQVFSGGPVKTTGGLGDLTEALGKNYEASGEITRASGMSNGHENHLPGASGKTSDAADKREQGRVMRNDRTEVT